jgi:predicted ribosome quality control (RQC) complex YloA/Tae2 family protein
MLSQDSIRGKIMCEDVVFKAVEKPLPKPTEEGYVVARLLESLIEARLALEFLERGLTRNAAGKVFQAWKALMAALLRLEIDKLKTLAKTEEERRWLEATAVSRVPTSKMKTLAHLLKEIGYDDVSPWTDKALNLHDYQYHGPDPDLALSKYTRREEAAADILELAAEVARRVETLKNKVKWTEELVETLRKLQETSGP